MHQPHEHQPCLLGAHLVNMVQLEVLEEQQQQRRDALHDNLLVPVHINPQLHALQDGDAGAVEEDEG